MDKQDKIEALQADLENLKDLFSRKVNSIEKQINDLSVEDSELDSVAAIVEAPKTETDIIEEPIDSIAASIETVEVKPEIIIEPDSPIIEEPVIVMNEQKTETSALQENEVNSGGHSWTPQTKSQLEEHKKSEPKKTDSRWTPPKPQVDSWAKSEPVIPREPMPSFTEMLTSLFLFIFAPLLKPLQSFFPQAFTLYKKFKEEERLSIFFLTVGGVVATILGFVFLLQYSFSNYLSEFAKILFGYAFAIAIIATGWKVTNKSEDFKDYGASLIGLGITLNYVCTYFISSYFHFVGDVGGFLLFGVNTVFAYFLALKFETRIVATITYIGGAFTPFLLNGDMDSASLYLSYLFLLSGAALHLSRKIHWIELSYFSFLSTLAIFEFSLLSLSGTASINLSIVGLIHAFFYLYVYYALFSGGPLALRETLNKKQLAIFCGSITLYLFNLYHYIGPSHTLGIILIVNALPFVFFLVKNYKASNQHQRALMTTSVATLLAISVPLLFRLDVIGLIWAQESLVLLYLGFVFASDFIKKEAYVVLVMSSAVIIWSIIDNYLLWSTSLLNVNTVSLLSVGVLLVATIKIIEKFKDVAQEYDFNIQNIARESLSLWMVVTYILVAYQISPDYMLISSVLPMLFMMYRGSVYNLSFTKRLGVFLYGLIFLQIVLSIQASDSFRFTHQTLQGKAALIESLLLLAFIQTFFSRLLPESNWLTYTKKLRVTFLFVVPLLLLPTVLRRAPEFFALALWVSFALNYYIAKKSKHSIIQKELVIHYFITLAVSILPIVFSLSYSIFNIENWPGLIAFGLALFAFHQNIYERILPDNNWRGLAIRWRVGYLFVLPLISLPIVIFNSPEYLSLALWGSFALTYYIAKKTKYSILQKELVVHYFATIAVSIAIVAFSQNPEMYSFSSWTYFVALVIALVALHRIFYERIIPNNNWIHLTKTLRITSLVLLSLIFIPAVIIFIPEFVPLALWLSFSLNYLIATRVDYVALKHQLNAHYFLSVTVSIFAMLDSFTANILAVNNIPIFIGLVISGFVLTKEGMLEAAKLKVSYLKSVMVAWFYHSCIVIGITTLFVTSRIDGVIIVVASYILYMSLKENRLPALKNIHALNYLVSMLMLGFVSVYQLSASKLSLSYTFSAVIGILAVSLILYIVKNENPHRLALIGSTELKRKNRRIIELWYAQILVAVLYMSLIKMFTGDWYGPVTTIALVVHGISIIFQSNKPLYKSLVKLAVIMFGAACIKIFAYDLEGFTLIQKILVFTIIGMILLVSAYYFNKIRNVEQLKS